MCYSKNFTNLIFNRFFVLMKRFTFLRWTTPHSVKTLLITVVWSFCAHAVPGQDAPYVRHFSPDDYHLQNQNWAIDQSPTAQWMYFANNGGLMEFDGALWSHVSLPAGQPVRSVAIGTDGRVYCGGFAEFGYWERQNGALLRYHSLGEQLTSELFQKEEIWHILPGRDFVLFQSFSTIYKYADGKVISLKPPGAIMFAQQIRDKIYVPVIGQGIYELLPDHTFRLLPGTDAVKDKIIQFLIPGPGESLWIGTENDGLLEWSNGNCSPWKSPLNVFFKKNQLNKGIYLQNGGWAIGTVLEGVYILDAQGQLQYHLNRANSLQNNTVLSLREDARHNLWVGMDKGIDLIELNAPLNYFTDQSGKTGTVYTAAQQGDRLYIGSNQGLFVRSGQGPFLLIDGTQGQVWDLKEKEGQLFCGHNSGTFLINGNNARKISDLTGGWQLTDVPQHPELMLQCTYTGLAVYQKNSQNQWAFSHKVKGLDMPIKKMVFDRAGYWWGVHPNKGLVRLQLNETFTQISEYHSFTKEEGLPAEHRLDLTLMGDTVVLNTRKGVFQIQNRQGATMFTPMVFPYTGVKYFPGHQKGLFFLIDSTHTRFYKDGKNIRLPLNLVPDYENIILLDNQRFLFCLENGFAALDLDRLEQTQLRTVPPAPVIRWVESTAGAFSPETASLKLDYAENTLQFHFAVPSYGRQPWFSWRLDGFSNEWSPWQSSPEQGFINLPAGKYTFRVKTDQSNEEASITFTIAQPWYFSWMAWIGYLIVAALILAAIELYNQQRWEKQKKIIEAEKEKEIEHRTILAEREKLSFEVDNKSRELSNAAFNLIRKNEALQNLKDTLLATPDDPNLRQKMIRRIDEHLEGDHDWEVFEEAFNRVHDNFFTRLMRDFPDMTQGDLRLAAYLRMNLSSKEIAPLLNMSLRGVENKRYRLRKKLGLPETENLAEYLISY